MGLQDLILDDYFQGENLNAASDEFDVKVTIGVVSCNITSLASTQLVCIPPQVQPSATDEMGKATDLNLPLVVVSFIIAFVVEKIPIPLTETFADKFTTFLEFLNN